jgi:subtilisin family serine protease
MTAPGRWTVPCARASAPPSAPEAVGASASERRWTEVGWPASRGAAWTEVPPTDPSQASSSEPPFRGATSTFLAPACGITDRLGRTLRMGPLDMVALAPLMELTSGHPDVTIALIDGPVASTHPELSAASIRELSGGRPGSCATRDSMACAHGTSVAGVLAASRGSAAPAICSTPDAPCRAAPHATWRSSAATRHGPTAWTLASSSVVDAQLAR